MYYRVCCTPLKIATSSLLWTRVIQTYTLYVYKTFRMSLRTPSRGDIFCNINECLYMRTENNASVYNTYPESFSVSSPSYSSYHLLYSSILGMYVCVVCYTELMVTLKAKLSIVMLMSLYNVSIVKLFNSKTLSHSLCTSFTRAQTGTDKHESSMYI